MVDDLGGSSAPSAQWLEIENQAAIEIEIVAARVTVASRWFTRLLSISRKRGMFNVFHGQPVGRPLILEMGVARCSCKPEDQRNHADAVPFGSKGGNNLFRWPRSEWTTTQLCFAKFRKMCGLILCSSC